MTSLSEFGAISAATPQSGANASGTQELVSSSQFLDLLVAQIQNQNPLEPLDGTEYVTQLAEFANLEQMTLMNEGIDGVNQGQAVMLARQDMILLGRQVTYPGNEVVLPEEGAIGISYSVNSPAENLVIEVLDENGVKLGEINSAPRGAGFNTHSWDGTIETDGGDTKLDPGRYFFNVIASNGGTAVASQTYSTGRVTGITYERNVPQLIVGDERINSGNIIRVTD